MKDTMIHVPAVIFEFTAFADGVQRFTYVSEPSRAILGISATALLANPDQLFSVIHPDDLSQLTRTLMGRSEGQCCTYWKGRLRTDENEKWIEMRVSAACGGNGETVSRGVILEAAGASAVTNEKSEYDALLEQLPIGVAIHAGGEVIFANGHAHRLIKATKPDQLVGMKVIDLVHPDDRARIVERIRKVSKGSTAPLLEERFMCLDGTTIDVESMAFPTDYKGQSAIQVIFRDITEKKRNEAQVLRSESLFMQLFQNLPMAVAMLDEAGKVTAINSGFEEMFGYCHRDVEGKNLNDYIVPEGLHDEGIGLNNLIASNQVVTLESVRRHRSGRLINVILCGVPILFEQKTIGIYGVYVDITERKRVEGELKIRNTELDNFVYKVSHDLRAPLSSILGLVNLSRMDGNTDNPMEYIDIIGEKVKALDNFIGDVLSHSKNLKMEVNISHVDLRKVIDQAFTELGYLEGAREMKRTVRVEGIDFYSDHWRVSEIFRNLASNAIKYRRLDADTAEVDIKISVDHLCADISFSDNGIGIRDSSLKRIFEMFYRATDQAEGSGIGLYIVKNAVDKLGGQINVASKAGHGTRFHILLPNRVNSALSVNRISEERR
jgi:PAS domain S-box-containing protein